eukprot:CAMPEP_0185181742 /NCGR_PEP_ID=MMETSP1140-20130426/844_1 /TAXON_ID=298111 /ORGANISM="Pavlova sp., Strain CCMP459" /LENGTH=61 /DNA_ID=CAMNT_0027747629 /DNA_START=110 /DNA_END=292 /DNA_ORIENTATION=-
MEVAVAFAESADACDGDGGHGEQLALHGAWLGVWDLRQAVKGGGGLALGPGPGDEQWRGWL